MMSKDPKWLFGLESLVNISQISNSFYNKCRKSAEELYGKNYSSYQPWMSSTLYADLSKIQESISSGCPIELRQDTLEQIQKVFLKTPKSLFTLESDIETNSFIDDRTGQSKLFMEIFTDINQLEPRAKEIFNQSWHLLESEAGWLGLLLKQIIHQILPIFEQDIESSKIIRGNASVSSHQLVGTICLELPIQNSPSSKLDLCISMAHELGHQVLIIYQRADRILESSFSTPVFSATRGTHRPAILAFHGAVAVSYMLEATRLLANSLHLSESEKVYVQEIEAQKRILLQKNLESLNQSCLFTLLGKKFISEMENLV